MIKVGISGAAGRMGCAVASLVKGQEDMETGLLLEQAGHSMIGKDAGGIKITDNLKQGAGKIDVFIDFTVPQATLENLKVLEAANKPVVIGTTGIKADEYKKIEEAAKKIPIVFASNFSVGVNVMWKLVKEATNILKQDYDIDIVESHHRNKKDAPSGTAVTTAEVIMAEKGLDYEKNVIYGREGRDNERPRDQLGVMAVRGGGVIGEHSVIFASEGDKIEIKHTAFSRDTFAAGAIKAARFIAGKKPGLYVMKDVLGLK